MSKLEQGILIRALLVVACGVTQLGVDEGPRGAEPARTVDYGALVNRTTKADRLADRTAAGTVASTPALASEDESGASGPVQGLATSPDASPRMPAQAERFCEPVVSTITEVSKLLPPGRCLV